MGVFGDDENQDQRIAILARQSKVDEKVSAADVDPTIVELGVARKKLEGDSVPASESWSELQKGVLETFESQCTEVFQATDQAKRS